MAQIFSAPIETNEPFSLQKRDNAICQTIVNGCPDLNFGYHASNTNTLRYYLNILNVLWVQDNLYNITINVKGEKQIPMKYLHSLKIIGVKGPQGTVQLYGGNEETYLIDNPTDYTVTFQISGGSPKDECNVWLPNFQIQYEYLLGDAAQYEDTWEWGANAFDLGSGCDDFDNMGNSQTDFPGYYWKSKCNEECQVSSPSSAPLPSTSTTRSPPSSSVETVITSHETYPSSSSPASVESSTFSPPTTRSPPSSSVETVITSHETYPSSSSPASVESSTFSRYTPFPSSTIVSSRSSSLIPSIDTFSYQTVPSTRPSEPSSSEIEPPTSYTTVLSSTVPAPPHSEFSSPTIGPTSSQYQFSSPSFSDIYSSDIVFTTTSSSASLFTITTTTSYLSPSSPVVPSPLPPFSTTYLVPPTSPTTTSENQSTPSSYSYSTGSPTLTSTLTSTMTPPTSNIVPPITPSIISEFNGKGNVLDNSKMKWLVPSAFIFIFNFVI
ncbi:uncharacterized protein NDAI_0J03060 [Naumovozyma dairenensis CBS 421]|uniref:Flo11 domain-containing protein n=1 Tax=Naumovozyma dairenensis (strain ATCC 10597 / BCRC 20456 / CBS 421 / NBRC 0211 / NRRL Y-12639) TaxID=1071378 RepID=G0WHC0_NAUDC|nr:hypothetical protein NDAI_0J03060 [Naumovozyma dairenensis CBS 421]CCD27198.1 hypothetical protein NDAI_0J03060 [Naumovozyma dairenensis CBS 421]